MFSKCFIPELIFKNHNSQVFSSNFYRKSQTKNRVNTNIITRNHSSKKLHQSIVRYSRHRVFHFRISLFFLIHSLQGWFWTPRNIICNCTLSKSHLHVHWRNKTFKRKSQRVRHCWDHFLTRTTPLRELDMVNL